MLRYVGTYFCQACSYAHHSCYARVSLTDCFAWGGWIWLSLPPWLWIIEGSLPSAKPGWLAIIRPYIHLSPAPLLHVRRMDLKTIDSYPPNNNVSHT